MKLEIIDEKTADLKNLDLLLAGVFASDDDKHALPAPKELGRVDKALVAELMSAAHQEGFSGKSGQSFVLRTMAKGAPRLIGLVGLGKHADFCLDGYRKLGGVAYRVSNDRRAKRVALAAPADSTISAHETLQASLEGFQLAKYRFDKYITENKPETHVAQLSILTHDAKKAKEALAHAEAISLSVCLARDLINEGPLVVNPQSLAALALKEGKALGLEVEVLDEKALAKEKMGLMLAVARASLKAAPPRLIRLAYRPKKKAKKHFIIAGKGVTFDSGGLDIKPSAGMLDMKIDMSGAAAVLGTMLAIARLKPDVAVTGYMGCVENGIGANAFHPGDVITSREGLTVEINNTDAEGRLVLADVLDYAQSRDKADVIIDLATLTGACIVALGPNTAGLFSNSEKLAEHIYESGKKAGEDFWRLPLNEELRDQLKSSLADMKNTGAREGGAITAALFIKKFVNEKTDWAHLDIAGPATMEKDHVYIPKGGAGFAVRTLVDLLCKA